MLKPREQVLAAVLRRFEASWAQEAAQEALAAGECGSLQACGFEAKSADAPNEHDEARTWPLRIALGRPSQKDLIQDISTIGTYIDELRVWADRFSLDIEWEERLAGGRQVVPTHVIVPDIDRAAALLDGADRKLGARAKLARARRRSGDIVGKLQPELVAANVIEKTVRATDSWTDIDFGLLVTAALWFRSHDATGLTPRQVPLEGFHAKWLDALGRRALIACLAGKDDLGLADRPARVDFAYLDSEYLAGGARRYDSLVIGDAVELPYQPRVIVIVENKDTYLTFPQLDGGMCIFGSGRAGPTLLAGIPWIALADHLFYWGDMDADGLEILDAYRTHGLSMRSILMDWSAFEHFERFGTKLAAGKLGLEGRARHELPTLESGEQALYERLTDPGWPRARRIEQERIPLDAALAQVRRMIDWHAATG